MSLGTEKAAAGMSAVVKKRAIWFIALIVIYFIISSLPANGTVEADGKIIGLTPIGLKSIALMVVAVICWITEVIPIAIASILFMFLQHIIGVMPMPTAVANFATPTVIFVLASFFLAFALSESGLSKRISTGLTVLSKGSPTAVVFYLMVGTAFISMFISDVPACAAFFPIGLAMIEKNGCKIGESNFAKAVLIGIPFAALIGGVGTPAGSSLNVLTLSLLQSSANVVVSFSQWATLGIPVVIIITPLVWLALTKLFKPEIDKLVGIEDVKKEYDALGPINKQEIKFIVIFVLLLITWFTESIHKVPLPISSTIGAAVFFLPGIDLLTWGGTKNRIGWDAILLIGAANTLGTTLWKTGAAPWIADSVLGGLTSASSITLILAVVVFTVVIHLLVPVNPAIVSILVPTLCALAVAGGLNPAALAVPMGFTVSAAFLLPLDPVPLITYQAGYYSMGDYFKAGVPASIIWIIVMTVALFVLGGPIGLF